MKRRLFKNTATGYGCLLVTGVLLSLGFALPTGATVTPLVDAGATTSGFGVPMQNGRPLTSATGATTSEAGDIDHLIVKYRGKALARGTTATITNANLQSLSSRAGVALTHHRPMSGNSHIFKLPKKMSHSEARDIADKLSADPTVEYAVPDRIMRIMMTPNDTQYPSQWHYKSPTTDGEKAGINLPGAWDITTGASSVVVAVIDTGIVNHADLQGRILPGYNFISKAALAGNSVGRSDDASDLGDWDVSGPSSWHGTHVAGTIAATTNNGMGVAGINWGAKILPVRVLGHGGGYASDIIDGIRWAAGLTVSDVPANPNPAKVINMSLGVDGVCDAATQSAINDAIAAGTTVVVAAGNSSLDAADFSPAGCSGVISVAALNRAGGAAYYTNYGQSVKIAAPGGEQSSTSGSGGILSTLNSGTTTPVASPGGDTYNYLQGTSQASPHVAGIVSLMLSVNPSLTPAQVMTLLQSTARPFPTATGSKGGDCTTTKCGAGIADAYRAVSAVSTNEIIIGTSPSALLFNKPLNGPNPPSQSLTISTAGSAGQSWSVSSSTSWLHVNPASGQGGGIVTVSVDAGALSPEAANSGFITITAAGVINSPVTIPVTVKFTLDLHTSDPCQITGHSQNVVDGNMYVIGGVSCNGQMSNSVYIYNVVTDTWTTGKAKAQPSAFSNGAVINGKIYIPGGFDTNRALDSLDIYDIATNQWTTGAPLPKALYGSVIETMNGKLYVIGGSDKKSGAYVSTNYVYDPASDTWGSMAKIGGNVFSAGSGVVNGKIYIFGGVNDAQSGPSASTWAYDPATDSWSKAAPLLQARKQHGGTVMGGKLYAFGGTDLKGSKNDIEVYDPATDAWSALPLFLNKEAHDIKASAVGTAVYVIGAGYNQSYSLPFTGPGQTVTFGPAPIVSLGDNKSLWATATSGLPVTFTSLTPIACSTSGDNGSIVTGLIDGTNNCTIAANQAGNTQYNAAPQVTQTFSIADVFRIITTVFPDAYTNQSYRQTLTATSGTPPYTWSITSGALPTGLALSSSGDISGTPAAAGTSCFTAQAKDAHNIQAAKEFSIVVYRPLAVATALLLDTSIGLFYSQTMPATGGDTHYNWAIISGTLPAGLTLSSDGVISGTPTKTGTSNFMLQVKDANNHTASKALGFTINAIITQTLQDAPVGQPYSQTLTAAGGTQPCNWSITSGALPAGLTLNSTTGVISGTSTVPGTIRFTVQVKEGTSEPYSRELSIATFAMKIAGGGFHAVALKSDGTVWAWGKNAVGQLGDGTTTNRLVPTPVSGLTEVTAIAAGYNHTVALKSNGTVVAWGISGFVTPAPVPGLTGVTAIAAGVDYTVALKSDGTVAAWDDNNHGQLGDSTTTSRDIPTPVPGLTGVIAIAASFEHTVALKSDGTVVAWGNNRGGQLGDGSSIDQLAPVPVPGLFGVSAISAGSEHTVALKSNGTVVVWGSNNTGQLGNGSANLFSFTPVQVLSGVTSIAAGYQHTVALKNNGTLVSFGNNYYGQLGDGTTTTRFSPATVSGVTGVIAFAAAQYHTAVIKSVGSVIAWGGNTHGQLGDGTTTTRYAPVAVGVSVAADKVDGTYDGGVTVTLSCNGFFSPCREIRYTLDGSQPTSASPLYSAPLTITKNSTLRFMAIDNADNQSGVNSVNYVFAPDILKGDVNNDGKVDMADALLTLQYALNLIPHTAANNAIYLAVADVAPFDSATRKPGGDGKIDVMDALVVLQRAVNLISW